MGGPKLPSLLPVVNELPRTGQITKKPFSRLELVDSTRVDQQHRLTRRQIGPPRRLGPPTGRHVKTISAEIQYRSSDAPRLVFRLDRWDVRKDPARGGKARLRYRKAYMRMSVRVLTDLVKMFGVESGALDQMVLEGAAALKAARTDYHQRRLAALAEVEAQERARARGRELTKPRAAPAPLPALEVRDLVGLA